jgi:hypothetical protein
MRRAELLAARKESYNGGSDTNCVEAGVAEAGQVPVRDTTDQYGAPLSIPTYAWTRFTDSLR